MFSISSKKIFIILALLLLFSLMLRTPFDPDLGWHLRNGQYLVANHHVQPHDLYTFTMADYPVIMHEWLTEIVMYLLYTWFGLWALSLFFCLVAIAAFIIIGRSVRAPWEYTMIASLIGAIASIHVIGVRPQIITLLILALIFFILHRWRANPAYHGLYFLPLIFLFWANLHGGFFIGLFAVGLFLFLELLQKIIKEIRSLIKQKKSAVWLKHIWQFLLKEKGWQKLFLIFVICCLVTLINPYGYHLYDEIFNTLKDSAGRGQIMEWQKVDYHNPNSWQMIIYAALLFFLLLFAGRQIDFTHLIIALVFFGISLQAWRNVPLFILASIPLWVTIVKERAGKTLSLILKKNWFLALFFIATAIIGYQQYRNIWPTLWSWEAVAKTGGYPYQAVQFLKNHPQPGRMFNEYNWGGFLIWLYPEKQVFIDGRTPIWRLNGKNLFLESQKFFRGEIEPLAFLGQYDIQFILVGSQNFVLSRYLQLNGWQEIYQDNLAIILVRP